MNEIIPKKIYQHFKGNLYYVHGIATHSETGEKLVIYQALYGDFGMWARPLSMFCERIEEEAPNNLMKQKYRFVEYQGKLENNIKAFLENKL